MSGPPVAVRSLLLVGRAEGSATGKAASIAALRYPYVCPA